MNKAELLKIYSAYLPFDVTVRTVLNTDFILKGISFRGSLQDKLGIDFTNLQRGRLHLWDLSYLTKEIDHEGKIITPIVEIMNGGDDIFEDMLIRLAAGLSSPDRLPYRIFIKLLSYHFNVFNIPESEYINKATLTNK